MAKAGIDLIIVDSVGAGVPKAAMEQKIADKGDMGRVGLMAAKWSKFLPELKGVIVRSRSCVVGISQLRKKINTGPMAGHGPDTQAQGGEAWKFYSEVRIMLRRVAQEKGKEYNALTHKIEEAVVGQTTRIKIDKCKISSAQGKEGDFYIRFGEGIDDLRSVVDIASNHGIIKKGGAWYNWIRNNGEAIKGCGMDDFKQKIRETDGAWPELYKMTVGAMSDTVQTLSTAEVEEDDSYEVRDPGSFESSPDPVEGSEAASEESE
jgi:recombination protein RecA